MHHLRRTVAAAKVGSSPTPRQGSKIASAFRGCVWRSLSIPSVWGNAAKSALGPTGFCCPNTTRMLSSSAETEMTFQGTLGEIVSTLETYNVAWKDSHIVSVEINRPKKMNAMNRKFWKETKELFTAINNDYDNDIRCVILTGAGKSFSAGLDLQDHADMFMASQGTEDSARIGLRMRDQTREYQESFNSVANCQKPVIAAVQGACIGGGVDLICAADVRYCTSDAYFCVKEAAIGITADVGTLQRLPRIVGNDSLVRELAFTARNMPSEEALRFGLVSRTAEDKESLMQHVMETAKQISSLSPLAVQSTKHHLNYARDHTIDESLEYQATWNSAMLQTPDIMTAAEASMTGQTPTYPKL